MVVALEAFLGTPQLLVRALQKKRKIKRKTSQRKPNKAQNNAKKKKRRRKYVFLIPVPWPPGNEGIAIPREGFGLSADISLDDCCVVY